MTATRPLIAFAPAVIAGRWRFCRIEGATVTPLRDCRTCTGHGSPGAATEHYILGLDEPPADETGHEVQR